LLPLTSSAARRPSRSIGSQISSALTGRIETRIVGDRQSTGNRQRQGSPKTL
jgi:hypothetical protein